METLTDIAIQVVVPKGAERILVRVPVRHHEVDDDVVSGYVNLQDIGVDFKYDRYGDIWIPANAGVTVEVE